MKLISSVISMIALLAASTLCAQDNNASAAKPAAAPVEVTDNGGVEINVSKENNVTTISVKCDAAKLGKSSEDVLDELFKRAIATSGVTGLHRTALNSALFAIKSQLKNSSSPESGVIAATFKLNEVTDNTGRAVILDGNVALPSGGSFALNTRTEPKASGGVQTTGNVVAADANGNAQPSAPISLAVDESGNVSGSVGNVGIAEKTPEALAVEQATTPTSKANKTDASEQTIPDQTIITTKI